MQFGSHPAFARLENRKTSYRFDLERDVPWHRLDEPGVFYTDALLTKVGFDPVIVAADPARAETLQWALALATSEAFVALERDVIAFVSEAAEDEQTRSATLLLEEEVKHTEMFERLAVSLRASRPGLAAVFDRHYQPPPSFEALRAQFAELGSSEGLAYLFWLNTVFFEEYTVWIHHVLDQDPGAVQPAWLAAHLCHRREETQHVLTDAAYLVALPLEEAERSRLSKAFVFFLERSLARYLCLDTAVSVTAELHPEAPELELQRRPPVFEDLVHHRAFRHTREAAPVLARLSAHAGDLRPRSVVEGAPLAPARSAHDTLPRRLEEAAREHPDHGVTFVQPGGSEQQLTYPALLASARRYQAGLRARGFHAGDVVMVQVLKPAELVPFFWGCLRAGIVPAPIAPPVSPRHANEQLARLLRIHELLDRPTVVTDPILRPAMEAFLAMERVDGVRFVEVGDLLGPDDDVTASLPAHPGWSDDVAFLQFSSGSMGHPRGVMLSHRNLIADAEAMLAHRGGRSGSEEVFCSWLPLYHDMGLIGYHLTPVVAGARQVLMTPLQFMKDPLSWLRVMGRHRATITGGPNFALSRVLRRLEQAPVDDLDLSALHCFLVGAEPIARPVLERFIEVLGPAGLRPESMCPGYGLAEATLAVTMTEAADRPASVTVARDSLHDPDGVREIDPSEAGALTVVDCGVPIPGVRVRIVDDEGETCPEGVVGAIEVAGPTVMRGFYRDAANTERVLDDAEWLDTGDLGMVRQGRLFVTGRAGDVFFVGGRNFYTHDVEAIAAQVSGVRTGYAALVVDWDDATGVDELTLFVGLEDGAPDDTLRRVHDHVTSRVGVAVGRVVQLERSGFARTTSGKLARHQLRTRDRAGRHAELPTFAHPQAPLEAVRTIWAEVLGRDPATVHIDDELTALGGTSIQAAEIHDRVERAWHAFFDQELLVAGTTVRRMAAWLATRGSGAAPLGDDARVASGAVAAQETAIPAAGDDVIAVVAIGCRYPGASSPEALWTLLRDGESPFREAPAERFDAAQLFDPRPHTPGRLVSTTGTFLEFEELTDFDPSPFGLSDAVARALDPQQRLFLQVCHEALQASRGDSRRVGVFAAAGDNEYALRYLAAPSLIGPHGLLGALGNMVAARVAQVFRLTGPALTVDTACSSSLMAVHLACRALRDGECDAALAGGVQVNLTESVWLYFSQTGLLSSSGECRPFDRDASGLVPGEGAGVVLLKTLGRARADGDVVLGIIRGTAVNNDGGSLSGTAPNPEGQKSAIRDAWTAAGVPMSAAGYVEAHAAGTAIGDAVEVHSLAEVFAGRERELPVGSVKSNLGHTLAASGVTSLIKVLLAIRYGRIPATVGCPHPAERIRFEETPLRPVVESQEWPAGERVAGVDSFGLGGTNVHAVVSGPGVVAAEGGRGVAFLLPGPGSQVAGMGRALYGVEPGYRAVVDGHGLAEALFGASDIDAIEAAQPAVFAHGVALAGWLAGLGLRPDAVIGHSAGELVAACLAGVISVAQGLELATVRGRAMAATRPGRMAAVFASRGEVERLLERVDGLVGIAACNAPEQTVVSGEIEAVRAAVAACEAAGFVARELAVGCGAHSELMAEAAPALAAAVERVMFEEPVIPWFSAVSGERLERVDGAYWERQLRAPVDFVAAVRAAAGAGCVTFVELGGTAGLSACVEAALGGEVAVIPLGDRDDVSVAAAEAGLQRLAGLGLVAPRLVSAGRARRLWIDAPARPREAVRDGVALRLEAEPAIRDHVTGGVATAPAALLVDLVLWDIRRRGDAAAALSDVVVGRPLALESGQTRVARVETEGDDGVRLVSVGAGGGEPEVHLSGRVIADHGRTVARLDLAAIRVRCTEELAMAPVYEGLAERGFALGSTMRAVDSVRVGARELLAELSRPPGAARGRWLDAALLDGATQAVAGLVGHRLPSTQGMFLGFGLGEVSVWEPVHGRCLAHVRLGTRLHEEMTSLRFDVTLCDEDGHVLAEVRDFAAKVKEPGAGDIAVAAVAAAVVVAEPSAVGRAPAGEASELGVLLRRLIGEKLRRAPESLPAEVPLARLGMDSMKAVELVRALEEQLGMRLPVTLLFEAQTLEALERVVAGRIGR